MGKVIKIQEHYKLSVSYQEQLKQNVDTLNEMKSTLLTLSINTATTGKWKEWSDNIAEGETFSFTEEMLKDTNDPNVNNLTSLIDEVINAIEITETYYNKQ